MAGILAYIWAVLFECLTLGSKYMGNLTPTVPPPLEILKKLLTTITRWIEENKFDRFMLMFEWFEISFAVKVVSPECDRSLNKQKIY